MIDKLTRDQAVQRIKDIRGRIEVDHLEDMPKIMHYAAERGAVSELKAIFDIKEWELK